MNNPEVHDLHLLRIHDGDTIVCDIEVGMGIWLHDRRIRLARINAPELPTPLGVAALNALQALIVPQATLTLITTGSEPFDNYGRVLGEVILYVLPHTAGINLSDWLLAHGYAQPWPAPQPIPQLVKETA